MPDKDNFGAVLQPLIEQVKWPADVAPTLNQCRTGSGSPGYSNQELFSQGGGGLIPTVSVAIQGSMIGRQDHNGPSGSGCSNNGEMFTLTTTDVHAVAQAIPLDLRNSQRDPEKHDAQNRQGLGVGSVGDPAPTVDASFVHGVAQTVAPTITATNDPSRSPQSSKVTQQVAAVYASTMTVRRLTPRECERLQGFPDDYTLIPWRKKAASDCPDGPRYKALGNSMAVNCMEWIGERIAAVEAGEDK
jgi:DNA (cytosine-5)-methyltransferase 1